MLTRLEFRNRFTQAEKVAIELAAIDNPNASYAVRTQSAALRVYLEDVSQATYVDVTRPDTIAGVQALETYGLIAAGRAAQILELPADQHPPVGGFAVGDIVRVLPPFDAALPGTYTVEGFGPNYVVLAGGRGFDPTLLEKA